MGVIKTIKQDSNTNKSRKRRAQSSRLSAEWSLYPPATNSIQTIANLASTEAISDISQEPLTLATCEQPFLITWDQPDQDFSGLTSQS
jgi:hypothetical protein